MILDLKQLPSVLKQKWSNLDKDYLAIEAFFIAQEYSTWYKWYDKKLDEVILIAHGAVTDSTGKVMAYKRNNVIYYTNKLGESYFMTLLRRRQKPFKLHMYNKGNSISWMPSRPRERSFAYEIQEKLKE